MSSRNTHKATTTRTALLSGVFCTLMLLTACSMMTNSTPTMECPPVSILGDASKVTRFVDGPGRDLIDIDFTGEVTHLSGKCFYEIDGDTGSGVVRVNVKPEFRIERGAANKTRQADFEYFVSIVDDQGGILDKQVFPYSAKYWKNRTSVKDFDKPVELAIPLSGGQSGQDFTIYVGFQLSREEVEFNRGYSK